MLKVWSLKLAPYGFPTSSAVRKTVITLVLDAHSCTVSDAYCCHFSYHALFNLRYNHRVGKTAAAKKLEAEKGIWSPWSREKTRLFLDEIPKWEPVQTSLPVSLPENVHTHGCHWAKKMTIMGSAEVTGNHCQKETSGWRFLTMEMLMHRNHLGRDHGPIPAGILTQKKPWRGPCSEDTMEETCIQILEMLREHLWHRWGPNQSEELRQRTPRMPAEAEFYAQMQATYDHLLTSGTNSKSPGRRP